MLLTSANIIINIEYTMKEIKYTIDQSYLQPHD